jgi:hypothetical protein
VAVVDERFRSQWIVSSSVSRNGRGDQPSSVRAFVVSYQA